ncbi:MAG: HAD family hydrolase, partial [Verrucomicrobiota bacterium]
YFLREKTEPITPVVGGIPSDLYFVHISLHGLIRGHDLELGRDADTGGQCKYVLELVKAMAEHERVGQVDLLTRRVVDPKVSSDYAKAVEPLGGGAFIRRVNAGPRRYLRKETLWRYLDIFVDQCLALFRENRRLPDIIHAHYADAGYVGSRLASLLGCPFVFTGHSLGRSKQERLLENASDPVRIKQRYNLPARIEAEELSLDTAAMVCTSTHQEVEKQYSVYEFYAPERMKVIPPGVDVSRFSPPGSAPVAETVTKKIERFLNDPDRPVVLAIARADEKKNLATLVKAFGQSESLRDRANLVVVAGNRDRIADLNPGAKKVWNELLQLIDDFDLYGCVSIPKHHEPNEIPSFYRYAASKQGIFVNPALMEPFGLTLIEAAASGLPVLATNDGGPRDILSNCKNGELIDPLDTEALTKALEQSVGNPQLWKSWSVNGLKGVATHYTWEGHVDRYLDEASDLLRNISQPQLITDKVRTSLPLKDRIVFTGLEDELLDGDAEAIEKIRELTHSNQPDLGFGIVSGRSIEMAQDLVKKHGLPEPDVYITQLGAEIHYGKRLIVDGPWEKHLSYRWEPDEIVGVLAQIPGLSLQGEEGSQHQYKISYHLDSSKAPRRREIQKLLREQNLPVKVILSQDELLDVIPLRSGKGHAIRYVTMRWGIPADRVLFYARRGSDYEALSGQFLGVLGSDHFLELKSTTSLPRVYLAKQPNFMGLLEGLEAYQFGGDIKIPNSAKGMQPEEAEEQEAVLSPDMVAHMSDGD